MRSNHKSIHLSQAIDVSFMQTPSRINDERDRRLLKLLGSNQLVPLAIRKDVVTPAKSILFKLGFPILGEHGDVAQGHILVNIWTNNTSHKKLIRPIDLCVDGLILSMCRPLAVVEVVGIQDY